MTLAALIIWGVGIATYGAVYLSHTFPPDLQLMSGRALEHHQRGARLRRRRAAAPWCRNQRRFHTGPHRFPPPVGLFLRWGHR